MNVALNLTILIQIDLTHDCPLKQGKTQRNLKIKIKLNLSKSQTKEKTTKIKEKLQLQRLCLINPILFKEMKIK